MQLNDAQNATLTMNADVCIESFCRKWGFGVALRNIPALTGESRVCSAPWWPPPANRNNHCGKRDIDRTWSECDKEHHVVFVITSNKLFSHISCFYGLRRRRRADWCRTIHVGILTFKGSASALRGAHHSQASKWSVMWPLQNVCSESTWKADSVFSTLSLQFLSLCTRSY